MPLWRYLLFGFIFLISLFIISQFYIAKYKLKHKTKQEDAYWLPHTEKQLDFWPKKLPNYFSKIRIVMPTMHRNRTGYTYLLKTIKNIKENFERHNLHNHFEIYIYQKTLNSEDEEKKNKLEIKDPRVNVIHFKEDENLRNLTPDLKKVLPLLRKREPLRDLTLSRLNRWNEQALSWYQMMELWHERNCEGSEIFLYMEDDFEICDKAFGHILALFQFGEMNLKDWLAIRMGFGFSGLFLQCRDIPRFLKVIKERSIIDNKKTRLPIDTALAMYWDPYAEHRLKRKHMTYRYMLFEHIGYESTVGNEEARRYKCFGFMKSVHFHLEEHFDWLCEAHMISPCPKSVQEELHLRQIPKSDIPLDADYRRILFERLGITTIIGDVANDSCNDICEKKNLKCIENALQFVNNCEYMDRLLGVTLPTFFRCVKFKMDFNKFPTFNTETNEIMITNNLNGKCHERKYNHRRACVCGEK